LPKLHKIAFKMVHSSTILLPAWKLLLQEQKRTVRIMPCDIVTRWNSTFDMLRFAIEYWPALEEMTAKREHNLRMLELSEAEWDSASELCEILKV
ncbi:hypothetical protein DFH29DRAFT_783596, partial [Suillus ampliporus]